MTFHRMLALAAVLPLTGCTSIGGAATDGPLPTPDAHGYGGFHVAIGQPITDKYDILVNREASRCASLRSSSSTRPASSSWSVR